jgi:hypothetical protein
MLRVTLAVELLLLPTLRSRQKTDKKKKKEITSKKKKKNDFLKQLIFG